LNHNMPTEAAKGREPRHMPPDCLDSVAIVIFALRTP
jgi:hypothetical protein